jgi:hypothetical protein
MTVVGSWSGWSGSSSAGSGRCALARGGGGQVEPFRPLVRRQPAVVHFPRPFLAVPRPLPHPKRDGRCGHLKETSMRDIHETAMAAAGRGEESLSGSGGPAPVVIASFLLPKHAAAARGRQHRNMYQRIFSTKDSVTRTAQGWPKLRSAWPNPLTGNPHTIWANPVQFSSVHRCGPRIKPGSL